MFARLPGREATRQERKSKQAKTHKFYLSVESLVFCPGPFFGAHRPILLEQTGPFSLMDARLVFSFCFQTVDINSGVALAIRWSLAACYSLVARRLQSLHLLKWILFYFPMSSF